MGGTELAQREWHKSVAIRCRVRNEHVAASGAHGLPDDAPIEDVLRALGLDDGHMDRLAKAVFEQSLPMLDIKIYKTIAKDEARLTRRIKPIVVKELIAEFSSSYRY